jgi:hypothetical protein
LNLLAGADFRERWEHRLALFHRWLGEVLFDGKVNVDVIEEEEEKLLPFLTKGTAGVAEGVKPPQRRFLFVWGSGAKSHQRVRTTFADYLLADEKKQGKTKTTNGS